MKIVYTTRFQRSHKRLIAKNDQLKNTLREHVLLFEQNPKAQSLKNHALQGKMKEYLAFSAGYDLRIIYRKEKNNYILFDIGTHGDIYE